MQQKTTGKHAILPLCSINVYYMNIFWLPTVYLMYGSLKSRISVNIFLEPV